MADLMFYGFFAAGSIYGLYRDYVKRNEFDQFKATGENSKNLIVQEGKITTSEPLKSTLHGAQYAHAKLAVNTITHQSKKVVHTSCIKPVTDPITGEVLTYGVKKDIVYYPSVESNEIWVHTDTNCYLPNTPILVGGKEVIIQSDTKLSYDRLRIQRLDDVRTIESSITNNSMVSVVGKKMEDGKISAKYLGPTNGVMDNVRGTEFGISNWITTGLITGALISLVGFANSLERRRQ
jgi:hypothetical protein